MIALTDAQIGNFWMHRDCIEAIRSGNVIAQFVSAFRAGMKALGVSARAADAPSEPSEREMPEGWLSKPYINDTDILEMWEMSVSRGHLTQTTRLDFARLLEAAIVRNVRAADALDSQPTDLPAECSDEMYRATTHICNLLEREDVNAMWRAMREVVLASGQPTDGGVRND